MSKDAFTYALMYDVTVSHLVPNPNCDPNYWPEIMPFEQGKLKEWYDARKSPTRRYSKTPLKWELKLE